jgi:hypothetical protein
MRLTVARLSPVVCPMRTPVQRWRRRSKTLSTKAKSVCRGIRCGRELRSRSPARPHSRYRRTHLAAVFVLTPKLAAASFSVHFSPGTFLANCSRRWIVSRAFW